MYLYSTFHGLLLYKVLDRFKNTQNNKEVPQVYPELIINNKNKMDHRPCPCEPSHTSKPCNLPVNVRLLHQDGVEPEHQH